MRAACTQAMLWRTGWNSASLSAERDDRVTWHAVAGHRCSKQPESLTNQRHRTLSGCRTWGGTESMREEIAKTSGLWGEVYRARDTRLGREVALKILRDGFAHDPERVARFRREAQLLAALNHPHIAAI